jgi:hypothetical protein
LGTPAGVTAFMASPGARPSSPTGLGAAPQSPTEIDLSWDAQAGVDAFKVQRSSGGSWWSTIATVAGSATSYADTSLAPSTTYGYRLLAVTSGRVSDPSATVSAATPAPPSYALHVAPAGAGSGTISSAPAGIDCGATCDASFTPGTPVTLTATPSAGSAFAGWSGDCTGAGQCQVAMSGDTAVTATFVPVYHLSVTKTGLGAGLVTSSPAGISCGATCGSDLNAGTPVELTAAAGANSQFAGWSGGGCAGTGACDVTMNAAVGVTATFVLVNRPDGLLAHASGSFLGDDVFNTSGAGQTQAAKVSRGHSTTFRWKIANDGLSTDSMTLKGAGGSTGFTVAYLAGRTNLTKAFVNGKVSATLAPGTSVTFTVRVTVLKTARLGARKSVMLTARSGNAAVSDAVLAAVTSKR